MDAPMFRVMLLDMTASEALALSNRIERKEQQDRRGRGAFLSLPLAARWNRRVVMGEATGTPWYYGKEQ